MRIANVIFATLSGDGTRDRGVTSLGGPGEKFHFAPRSNKSFCTMPATKCSSGKAPLTAASRQLCVMPPSNVFLAGILGDTTTLSERSCKIDMAPLAGVQESANVNVCCGDSDLIYHYATIKA